MKYDEIYYMSKTILEKKCSGFFVDNLVLQILTVTNTTMLLKRPHARAVLSLLVYYLLIIIIIVIIILRVSFCIKWETDRRKVAMLLRPAYVMIMLIRARKTFEFLSKFTRIFHEHEYYGVRAFYANLSPSPTRSIDKLALMRYPTYIFYIFNKCTSYEN